MTLRNFITELQTPPETPTGEYAAHPFTGKKGSTQAGGIERDHTEFKISAFDNSQCNISSKMKSINTKH